MPKNIALFIDGTWNSPSDPNERTNVHKLFKAAEARQGAIRITNGIPIAASGSQQVAHYIQGVGTGDKIDEYIGGISGFGTAEKIREAYLFLALNYELGDRIYMFGFSRGAFAARALAGFVGVVGPALKSANAKSVAAAYRRYVKATGEERYTQALIRQSLVSREQAEGMRAIPIHFIGVWDTVMRLGLQVGRVDLTARWTKHHRHPSLPNHITHARHALALHDLRPEFEPTLWEDWDAATQSLEQVWFPGAHSDIGGGYVDCDLSDVPLHWMASESQQYGLHIDAAQLPGAPNPSATVHYARLLGKLVPRRILSTWQTKLNTRVSQSFFMHRAACSQLLIGSPRTFRFANDKARRKHSTPKKDQRYRFLLATVDQLALRLHLELTEKQGKRYVR